MEKFDYNEWKKEQEELAKVNRLRRAINKTGIGDKEKERLHDQFEALAKRMARASRVA